MNREIKFRVWDLDDKIMDYDFKNTTYDSTINDEFHFMKGGQTKGIPMQNTGLKDKDGVEIYEGDILKRLYYHTKEMVVKFGITDITDNEDYGENQISGFYLEDLNGRKTHMDTYLLMKVIGNIYENKELLEK